MENTEAQVINSLSAVIGVHVFRKMEAKRKKGWDIIKLPARLRQRHLINYDNEQTDI
jgi:hypothetical protein